MLVDLEYCVIPEEAEALRPRIRTFLALALPSKALVDRARSWQGFDPAFSKALGSAGFIGLTLPTQYGGHGLGGFARFVVVEELLSAGAPVAAHWIADRQSAPLLLRYGTEAQRRAHIPSICKGERYFCIGMSEPGTGSDLASVRTRAVPCADGKWCLDGAKIWTTNAQHAHYMIALVRTSGTPDDRHRGLSQVIINLSLPGISIRPIRDIAGDSHFCEVHFDGVELEADAMIGEEGQGWTQVTAELALERSGPERIYSTLVLLDAWIARLDFATVNESTLVAVGKMVAELATLRALSIAVTAKLVAGESPVTEAALMKDLGTEFEQRVPQVILALADFMPANTLDADFRAALLYCAQIAPTFSLRGGTREILRGIIARELSK